MASLNWDTMLQLSGSPSLRLRYVCLRQVLHAAEQATQSLITRH
jgi:hypothetical protein